METTPDVVILPIDRSPLVNQRAPSPPTVTCCGWSTPGPYIDTTPPWLCDIAAAAEDTSGPTRKIGAPRRTSRPGLAKNLMRSISPPFEYAELGHDTNVVGRSAIDLR